MKHFSTAHGRLFVSALSFFVVGAIFVLGGSQAEAGVGVLTDNPDHETWVTNGQVHAVERTSSVTYVGGNFEMIGPYTGNATTFSRSTLEPDDSFPIVNGNVNASVDDGAGGLYIGGAFNSIGEDSVTRLAHINSDGTLDTGWNPAPNSTVYALHRDGSTLYVGGYFSSIGGQSRDYIAAVDTATGLATAWNPSADEVVRQIVKDGTTVYIAGDFNNTGGQVRNYLAALDSSTGLATSWNPSPNSIVNAMVVDTSVVYAGGDYSTIGGQSRASIAAIDRSTGLATSWDPSANGLINDLELDGSQLYAAGSFTTIGGQTRNYIAALDTSTGLATTWNPNADWYAYSVFVDGSTVYAGGLFDAVGGLERHGVVALNKSTAVPLSWTLNTGERPRTFNSLASDVFMGGDFTFVEGLARGYGFAFDNATKQPTSWNPGADFTIFSLEVDGSLIYAGGAFIAIGGQSRNRIAALDTTTALATSWDPNASTSVLQIISSGGTIYVGGLFSTIGGQTRNRIAALDPATGLATSWDPNASSNVFTMVLDGTDMYVGGLFTTIGGQTRNRIAVIDTTTGLATSWNPNASGQVEIIDLEGSLVYVGGNFTTIGGQSRNRLAALDKTTGLANSWNPDANNLVYGLVVDGATTYVGGGFSTVGGQSRVRLAAVDSTTGAVKSWNPGSTTVILDLSIQDDILHAMGTTFRMGSYGHGKGIARFFNPSVEFSKASASVAESSTTTDAPLAISDTRYGDTTVTFAVTGGSAIAGEDYTVSGSTATIDALMSGGSVPITILEDVKPEGTETIELTISGPTDNVTLGAQTTFTLSIIDSDAAVVRIPGDTPGEQAINVSKQRFASNGSASCGILARKDLMVDAFVVDPLASLLDCTLLLTDSGVLESAVLTELSRSLGGAANPIYVVGGEQALASQIITDLTDNSFSNVSRFDGTDRRHTARLIADEIVAKNASATDTVMLTEDQALVDALSVSAVAGRAGDGKVDPILISKRRSSSVDPNIISFLSDNAAITKAQIIGGTTALPGDFEKNLQSALPGLAVTRLSGIDRFATNISVINANYSAPTKVVVARGDRGGIIGARSLGSRNDSNLFGALLAGSLAADLDAPLALVTSVSVPDTIADYIADNADTIELIYLVGSTGEVNQAVADHLGGIM